MAANDVTGSTESMSALTLEICIQISEMNASTITLNGSHVSKSSL